MGIFDRLKGKKTEVDWSNAAHPQPNLEEEVSLLSLAEGEETVLPKDPWKEYPLDDGGPVDDWKLVLIKRNHRGNYFVIGHAGYANAINGLEPYILDSDKKSVLIRALTGEELVGLVESWRKRETYYPYVAPLSDRLREKIESTFQAGVEMLGISDPEDGEVIAQAVKEAVDRILETGKYPEGCGSLSDAAVTLGVLFGQSLCIGRGWSWEMFGSSAEKAAYGVVSPERNFSNAPGSYLLRILRGKNIGLDGQNDNTVMLLYNMLEGIDGNPEEKLYFPLA